MLTTLLKPILCKTLASLCCGAMLVGQAQAASGEMGTGIPHFGVYSAGTGVSTIVWSLKNAAIGFPAACGSIVLSPTTMGMDTYKINLAILITAKSVGKRVRFYAHAERDGGCGVDYVELQD
jgi:tetrahydromethanopterin S-methyltransferase subunit C